MPEDTKTVDPSDGSEYENDDSEHESDGSNAERDRSTDGSDRSTDGSDGSTDGSQGTTDGSHGTTDGSDRSNADRDEPEYERFQRLEGVDYDRVNEFLKGRVDFTAREWALARLCADFRTKTGVEMKRVGEHLPELVPFMDETYTRQGVYQARRSFEEKVREAAATFLYGAYSGFFTAEEVDDVMYEATEVAKLLLEVEGASVPYDEEVEAEERLTDAMRGVHEASVELRYDRCPHCGEELCGDEAV